MCFLFFLLTGALWYYHDIYIEFIYFASFTVFEDDILKLYLICPFRDWNLAENVKNLVENLLNKYPPWSSWSLFFPGLSSTKQSKLLCLIFYVQYLLSNTESHLCLGNFHLLGNLFMTGWFLMDFFPQSVSRNLSPSLSLEGLVDARYSI